MSRAVKRGKNGAASSAASSASESRVENLPTSVGKMYIHLYTFSYTEKKQASSMNTISNLDCNYTTNALNSSMSEVTYLYWFQSTESDPLFRDLSTLFEMYYKYGIFSAYSCDIIKHISIEEMKEIMILCGAMEEALTTIPLLNGTTEEVYSYQMNRNEEKKDEIFSLLFQSGEIYQTQFSFKEIKVDEKVGHLSNKCIWEKENEKMDQELIQKITGKPPIQTKMDQLAEKAAEIKETSPRVLFYSIFFDQLWVFPGFTPECLISNTISTFLSDQIICEWYETMITQLPYSTILLRCKQLIDQSNEKKEKKQEVESSLENKKEEESKDEKNEMITNNTLFMELFIELYLEPKDGTDLLLSELYAHYQEVCKRCSISRDHYVTFFTFTKSLRSKYSTSIKRKAKGIYLVGFQSLVYTTMNMRPYLSIPLYRDAHTLYHKHKDLIESLHHPYARECVLILSTPYNGVILPEVIELFANHPAMKQRLAEYKYFLDIMGGFDKTTMDFNEMNDIFQRLNAEGVVPPSMVWPFSNVSKKTSNRYESGIRPLIGNITFEGNDHITPANQEIHMSGTPIYEEFQ